MTTSAARELYEALDDCLYLNNIDDPLLAEDEALPLITAALKRCRNETLEEVARECEKPEWDYTSAAGMGDDIRNLKEPE